MENQAEAEHMDWWILLIASNIFNKKSMFTALIYPLLSTQLQYAYFYNVLIQHLLS